MKMKHIHLSFLVLSCLLALTFSFYVAAEDPTDIKSVFLDSDQDSLSDEEEKMYGTDPQNSDTDGDGYSDGVEVQSGYDPTIPAPGDRIIANEDGTSETINVAGAISEENLTQKVAEKISTISSSATSEDQDMTIEETQQMIDEVLASSSQISEDSMPEIKLEDIKIKEQNYDNLSEERQLEKKRDDFIDYLIAIYYILSSNSNKPITSGTDITSYFSTMTNKLIMAISVGNSESIKELTENSEKVIEQMKEVEVPEDSVDLHIKGLRFAYFSLSLKDSLKVQSDDPLSQIASYAKIQALLGEVSNYSVEIATKFGEYGIEYNDDIRDKLKNMGLFAPEEGDLPSDSSED